MMQRVETYWNLHRQCLSYRETKRGAQVKHAQALLLNDCTLSVQPAGRERVLYEGRKNVHAFIRGTVSRVVGMEFDADDRGLTLDDMLLRDYARITYNPYKYDSFVLADTEQPISRASQIALIGKNVFLTRSPSGAGA